MLKHFSLIGVHLGGVLVGDEVEKRMLRLREDFGDCEVKLAKELIDRRGFRSNVERKCPAKGRSLERPADELLVVETLALDITVGFSGLEKSAAEIHPLWIF